VRSNPAWPESRTGAASDFRILGVDPGSIVTGWGLVGGSPSRPEWLASDVIRLAAPAALADRLSRLHHELTEIVERLQPTAAAVEAPYQGVNARSAFQLVQARGVVLAVLAGAGLDVGEYSPATVKKAVTGNGRASKGQVQSMVRHLLRRPAMRGALDVTDALAVALCHQTAQRHLGILERTRR
jgi:crossover junction endodeoxyribonuclease RuvC